MFTRQIQRLVSNLRGIMPDIFLSTMEDTLGQCDATLEHRGPVIIETDGINPPGGGTGTGTNDPGPARDSCWDDDDAYATLTLRNEPNARWLTEDPCDAECFRYGLALNVEGPANFRGGVRIDTAYIKNTLDECGNPIEVAGVELIRYQITDALPDAVNPHVALARKVIWNGTNYIMTGDEFALVDWHGDAHRFHWEIGAQGWAQDVTDRETIVIAPGTYDVYEAVTIEGHVRFCEFELTADMSAGSATANILYQWGAWTDGFNVDTAITVYDRLDKIPDAVTGDKGFAVWDEFEGQWVIVAGLSTSKELIRFELVQDMTINDLVVDGLKVEWIAAAYSTVGAAISIVDAIGDWTGKVGYRGWGVRKEDRPTVGGQDAYEIVYMEGMARYIRFTLEGDLRLGSAIALVDAYWGNPWNGKDPGVRVTVYDPDGLFISALNGAKGVAVWKEVAGDVDGEYQVIECESKAGEILTTSSVPYFINPPGTQHPVDTAADWWGSQQDDQNPNQVATIHDISGFFEHNEAIPDPTTRAISVYDADEDRYILVWSQSIAKVIEFTLTDNLDLGEATCTVAGFYQGQNPGPAHVVSDNGDLFQRSLNGAVGIGVYHNSPFGSTYEVVECQSKAGLIEFTSTRYMGEVVANEIRLEGAPTRVYGTQQDIQTPPGSEHDVADPEQFYKLALTGASVQGIYDNDGDEYRIVNAETMAKWIRGRLDSALAVTDENVQTATIHAFFQGQDPLTDAAQVTIHNMNNNKDGDYVFEGDTGDYFYAFLDDATSTPTDPHYIIVQVECP